MNIETALKWIKQATHDLEMASKNNAIGGYDTAAFLAQQAVEKALKALYAAQGKPIPRIHYVEELAKGLKLPEDIIDAAIDLSADYMFTRYPDITDTIPFETYTEDISREKIEKASAIFACVKQQLSFFNIK